MKSGTEVKEFIIPMPVCPTYRVISVHDDKIHKELFIMTGITEKEYNKLVEQLENNPKVAEQLGLYVVEE